MQPYHFINTGLYLEGAKGPYPRGMVVLHRMGRSAFYFLFINLMYFTFYENSTLFLI